MDLCADVIREIVSYLRVDLDVLALACCSKQFYYSIFEYDDRSHLDHVVCFGRSSLFEEYLDIPELREITDSIRQWYYYMVPEKRCKEPAVFIGVYFYNRQDLVGTPGDVYIWCNIPSMSYYKQFIIECTVCKPADRQGDSDTLFNECAICNASPSGKELCPDWDQNYVWLHCRCTGRYFTKSNTYHYCLDGRKVYFTNGLAVIIGAGKASVMNKRGAIVVDIENKKGIWTRNGELPTEVNIIFKQTGARNDVGNDLIAFIMVDLDGKYIEAVFHYTDDIQD